MTAVKAVFGGDDMPVPTNENAKIGNLDLALLRHLLAKKVSEAQASSGVGWLRRKMTGTDFASLNKKLIVVSNEQTGIVPASDGWPLTQVGFFVLSDDDADIGVKTAEVGAVVLAVTAKALNTAAGQGAFGTTISSIHEAHARASQYQVSMPSAGMLGAVAMRWAEHGLREEAQRTGNMWALATRKIVACGAVAIAHNGKEKEFYIRCCTEHQLDSLMTYSHNKYGLNTPEARKYVRGLCTQEKWQYKSLDQTFKKVANSVELHHLAA